jgi:hypothetical protein
LIDIKAIRPPTKLIFSTIAEHVATSISCDLRRCCISAVALLAILEAREEVIACVACVQAELNGHRSWSSRGAHSNWKFSASIIYIAIQRTPSIVRR